MPLLSLNFIRRAVLSSLIPAVFAVSPTLIHSQTMVSPTGPTASEDPAVIDQIWQRASAKYDVPRAAILKEVDNIGHQGPFRPDWESLQKYEAPRVVQGREIWNLHSLGRLFRPRVRQRVVSTQHVS